MRLKDMTPEAREEWRAETTRRYPDLVEIMRLAGPGLRYSVRDDRGVVGDEELEAQRQSDWERGAVVVVQPEEKVVVSKTRKPRR